MRDPEATSPTQPIRPTSPPSRPAEETARLGDEIYERDIRTQVETDHIGEVVAIDVESGCWAIGEDEIAATDRLQAQRPDAYDVWCLRVGYRGLYSFGGGSLCGAPSDPGCRECCLRSRRSPYGARSVGAGPRNRSRDRHRLQRLPDPAPALVTELGLAYRDRGRAILADGSEATLDVYDVAVLWDSRLRNTRASAADTTPLVGMRLLDSHSLYVEVEDGGRVVIQAQGVIR